MAITAPGILPASTSSLNTLPMRPRRAEETPTASGRARGRGSAARAGRVVARVSTQSQSGGSAFIILRAVYGRMSQMTPSAPTSPEAMAAALAAKGPGYVPRTHHLRPDGSPRFTNRLVFESSPYLLQHAHNPVNWYPWG